MRELTQAIRRSNKKSSKGPDGVSNRIIRLAFDEEDLAEIILQTINNQIFKERKYPQTLKSARIIPLPKPKQGEYRPISLLPSLSKLVEYMIQIRMRGIIEMKLPAQQFGCRPGHSTTQALKRLLHYSGMAAGARQQFGAIVYDFTKHMIEYQNKYH